MKRKNKNQIIRFDGKNVFMEVMNSAFEIGKVQINFVEYDLTLEKIIGRSKIFQSILI